MNDENFTVGPDGDSRVIRIFISSTFRDMMQERDLLVKQVFPDLRRICARRFVTFTEVDLRWGITKEQAAEGKVLPLCLAEIHRCRPYFLGLLGERYGWIPDTIPAEVIKDEPWLTEHLHGRTSVTELEILHGVLNNTEMRTLSFFYFRDRKWIESLPEAERGEMIERDIPLDVERYGAQEAFRRTQERKDKLTALKNRIRESGLPVVEDYASPEVLAKTIREQFEELIDRLYPEQDVPEVLDRERLAHEAHAKNRLFACIERPSHLAALNRFADSEREGKGLVVTGESGGGKSVLLAAWARDWAKNHSEDFPFQHYFGSTSESAAVDGFLRRLLGELKRRFDIAEEIPTESDKLREALPLWLAETTGRGQIVLVLDGLNQVQGDEPDRRLAWLPRFFQPQVTVLASSLPGPALDTLHERGWHEHDLPLADEHEIEAMVDAYLAEYRKTLASELRRDLVNAQGSRNPLFLRTVLEELRQFGSFEKLPDRVAHYLEADNPRDLFQRVLRRWQKDFDAGRNLIRRAVSCLWAARMGLSESEWLDLLGEGGDPLPRAIWTPLFLAMEPHLTQRAGLLAFGHDFLRQAVAAEFLQTDSDQRAAHLVLADYFADQLEMTPRKSDEWPWQLQEAEEWDRLQEALTDRNLFLALFKSETDVELGRYWVRLREARPAVQMGKLYREAFALWEAGEQEASSDGFLANHLGVFLFDSACYEEAEPMYRRALEIRGQFYGPDHPEVATSLNNLALLLYFTNRLSEAEPLHHRALEIDEQFYGLDHPDVVTSLNNLAGLLYSTNRLSEAEPLYRRALEINEQSYGPDHPDIAISANNLAGLLYSTNRLSEAEPLYRRALEINEQSYGPDHPEVATSLNNLALLLRATNRPSEAELRYRRALQIREQSYGPDHPDVANTLVSLAALLKDTNRLSEAEPRYRRALQIYEQSYGPNHFDVATSLNNLATLLHSANRLSEAEPLIRRALEVYEKSYGPDHPEVAAALNNLAELLRAANRLSEAEPLMRRMVEIFIKFTRDTGHPHPNLQAAVDNYAGLLQTMGRSQEEIATHLRSLAPELFDA
jgi:nephrocystin-3